MAEDTKNNQNDNKDEIAIPDFTELWKDMYFKAEESWGTIVKEIMNTTSYINTVNQMRNQSLKSYEMTTQNLDKLMENNPFAGKKDIANLAELVIGIEDKFDDFEFQFSDQIKSITLSLIKLLDFQIHWKDDLDWIKTKINEMQSGEEVLSLQKQISALDYKEEIQSLKLLLNQIAQDFENELKPLKNRLENLSLEGEVQQILQQLKTMNAQEEYQKSNNNSQKMVSKEDFEKLLIQLDNAPNKKDTDALLEGMKILQNEVAQLSGAVKQIKADAEAIKEQKPLLELDVNAPARKRKSVKRNDKP